MDERDVEAEGFCSDSIYGTGFTSQSTSIGAVQICQSGSAAKLVQFGDFCTQSRPVFP